MKDKDIQQIEIDLQRLFRALRDRSVLIGIVAVICAVIAFLGTCFLITPQYQSAVMFYVNNNALSPGEGPLGISSADMTASRGLVKSCIVILNSRETLHQVIDDSGVARTCEELKDMITAEAVDATEIFRVVVTCPDPLEAEKIADSIAHILPKRISGIMEGASAKIVDSAVAATSPSSPSCIRNTGAGFAIGLFLSMGWVVFCSLMDITIRSEEDVTLNCEYPVLASIPDMEVHNKGGSIGFAAEEAYKLLYTKLRFFFGEAGNCRVIGVTSALPGEGKSITAVNLADAISQLGKRVLLVDCDMRRSDLADKLPIRKKPGLSEFLGGQVFADKLLQPCSIRDDVRAFYVISSGYVPLNPMELLSSGKMECMVERLRQDYDYMILDLPPVGEVADALAAARLTDGMLLVVRRNCCDRTALDSAIRQFAFADTKILGVVFNAAGSGRKRCRRHGRRQAISEGKILPSRELSRKTEE